MRNQERCSFAKVKVCVRASSTGYQMASCAAQLPSALLPLERAGAQGHGCVCPETRLLSWRSTRDKDPSSPGGCGNSRGLCGSLAAKVRAGYDTGCVFHVHTHTHTHAQIHTHSQLSNRSSGLPRTTVLTAKERRSSLNGLVIPA